MAKPTTLTRSGMLYEGNYASWAKRMDATLEMHNIDVGLDEEMGLHAYNEELSKDGRLKATTLITNSVSEYILGRILNSRKHDPEGLLGSLRALAKPFRFSDLPPELRGRIYNIWFKSAQRHEYTFWASQSWTPRTPNMLLISRATRLEALPFFYRSSEFLLSFRRSKDEIFDGRATHPVAMMRRWAEIGIKHGLRDLRRSCVRREYRHPIVVVTLDVNRNKGLTVTFERETQRIFFPEDQKEAWMKHIEQVEADRKALGLLGEALILAFTSKPELWERPS
ncbi:hypothetical protein LTS10_002442 [Elasticomyces elasticus]|nr:hypothetical protein LTS10_002442 [Elasticomyces elasticus]